MSRAGRSEDGRTGDEWGGRSELRVEKQMERAQNETGAKGGCVEEEGAGGKELVLKKRTSTK